MSKMDLDFMFDWVEYSVVVIMLILSLLVGAYYTFLNKQKTYSDYMLGGRTMGVLPVSMSIVASFISGISILGLPTEMYLYGSQCMTNNIANLIIMTVAGVFYLPVYHKLQLSSLLEYLELRFDSNVRFMGTLMYTMASVLHLPAIIYVPGLAFNQVTGVPLHIITPIISICCLFYTAFGGVKAVMWSDTIQNMFTLAAVIFVILIGSWRLGGILEIWRINEQGSRLEIFNMDPDPFARNTFLTVTIGSAFFFLTNIVANPGTVQRFLSVPSIKHIRCTMASYYNATGGMLYKDVMEVFFPTVHHSEAKQFTIIKVIIFVLGIISVAMVFVVEKLGTVLQMSVSLLGAVYGSILSLFTLGIFFPFVNTKGALAGSLTSLVLSGWIVFNAQYYIMNGKLQFPGKFTSIGGCSNSTLNHFSPRPELVFNYTGVGSEVLADNTVPQVYQLSYNYYTVLGTLTGVAVAMVVSLLTQSPDITTMNPDLFTPFVHRFMPARDGNLKSRPRKDEYVLTNQKELG
ncbi:sodium-coupled monocarboxylate transporter 1-like isoform X2 [Homalodisca vitripennis]|uniref:sodium-coupled monocarboxylate transporter 1-like isoform X2 n=1 Tax=Homalodisca vitripennis TaxID=197043 RepID=UPI001EEB0F7A|nr:sodium-coupled monocarboxylate transporter 1-like isoform X2 [Homalodisca vitripennis]